MQPSQEPPVLILRTHYMWFSTPFIPHCTVPASQGLSRYMVFLRLCRDVVKNGFFRFGALFTYDGLTRPDCWCISNIGIQFPTIHLWDLFLSSVFAFTTKESGPARLPMVSQLVSLQPFASKNFPV